MLNKCGVVCDSVLHRVCGSCNFVVISAVDVCIDYGGVHVSHVCGVGICVDARGVVRVVEWCLFLKSRCCLLCCHVV